MKIERNFDFDFDFFYVHVFENEANNKLNATNESYVRRDVCWLQMKEYKYHNFERNFGIQLELAIEKSWLSWLKNIMSWLNIFNQTEWAGAFLF